MKLEPFVMQHELVQEAPELGRTDLYQLNRPSILRHLLHFLKGGEAILVTNSDSIPLKRGRESISKIIEIRPDSSLYWWLIPVDNEFSGCS